MTWDHPGLLKTRGVVARSASLACTRPWRIPHAGEDTLQSKTGSPIVRKWLLCVPSTVGWRSGASMHCWH